MANLDYVLPGQKLGSTTTHQAGPGTHIFESQIVASTTGHPETIQSPTSSSHPLITVTRSPSGPHGPAPTIPTIGSTVLAQITRTSPLRGADCLIHAIALPPSPPSSSAAPSTDPPPVPPPTFVPCPLPHPALIQPPHIRLLQTPPLPIHDLLRPGDVVRARVLSLGDGSQFYLSTAGTENGVIMARAQEAGVVGGWMAPVSWREMRDLRSGRGEPRKVARPVGAGG